jgi:hypothetical protein
MMNTLLTEFNKLRFDGPLRDPFFAPKLYGCQERSCVLQCGLELEIQQKWDSFNPTQPHDFLTHNPRVLYKNRKLQPRSLYAPHPLSVLREAVQMRFFSLNHTAPAMARYEIKSQLSYL